MTADARPAPARSRRALLTAAAAAGGALATQALVRPSSAAAASATLGVVNTATAATTIRNTQALSSAKAIVGLVTHGGPGGSTAGIQGQSNSLHGNGVFGVAMAGNSKGVWGRSAGGRGVYGEATATTGQNHGVYGETKSAAGFGVFGVAPFIGVYGRATPTTGYAVGVYGESLSPSGSGVYAINQEGGTGVHTFAWGNGAYGIYAEAWANSGTFPLAHAGYFQGRVHVEGPLTKTSGSFLIDHPMDPANRTLEHSFVEAPEMLNVYRGTVTLGARGRATIRLPRYFRALNASYGYQLTAIGAPAPELHVAREISGSSFAIAGGAPGQKVCWIVTGARQDAWAKAYPLRVERRKRGKDRGRYLNPGVHGQPRSAAIHATPDVGLQPRARRRRNRSSDAG